MLIKEIINGISQKIYGFYEGLYDIYVEEVEQGLQMPCFMINLILSDIRMMLKPRYKFESVFDVIYFGDGYKDCMDRGSELYDILEYITIKGFKRKGSIDPKGEDFKYNQTIRVIDQIGNDIAVIFNTQFLGKIPNDESGRAAL